MLSVEPPSFTTTEGALAYLQDLCRGRLDISNVAYLALSLPGRHEPGPVIVSTYRPEWVDHYLSERYALIDPAIVRGIRGFLPFDWRERPTSDPSVVRFFGEAQEFGVNPNGLSIPIRGPHGDRAIFSINSDLPDQSWQDFKLEHQGDITIIAHWFHMEVVTALASGFATQVALSPRERDVLLWAAEGKTAWETSQILSLSQKTVEAYISSALYKLKANSKAQAIAHAMRWGLLD